MQPTADDSPADPAWLARPDGARLAYRRIGGGGRPGVVFCTGFVSDMTGGKAVFLEDLCRRRGRPFVRFDYQGHGRSDGRFEDGTIGRWAEDTVAVLDSLTQGPQILVGSSMGVWTAVLAARARPDRIAGLVGVAAAADFTEDVLWPQLDARMRTALERDGVVRIPSRYGAPTPVTRRLIEDAREHLVLRAPIPLRCPARLIHGLADADVPWRQSLRLLERLQGTDVRLELIKDGEHRLSRPQDLARLGAAVVELAGVPDDGAA